MIKLIWFNEEYLPTRKEPQKRLFLLYPTLYYFGIDIPTSIGYFKNKESVDYCFIILGFGVRYNKNWDE